MDNRIIAAGGGLFLLAALGAGGAMMMGSGTSTPDEAGEATTEPAAKKGKKAAKRDLDAPGYRSDNDPANAEPRPDGPVKAGEAEPDPDYEERAKVHRERREQLNTEWRAESTMAAQQWVAGSGLDEGTGQQVMSIVNKAHNTIAQTRADLEDGVIRPATGREEMKWAKEDVRVELENLIGKEKSEELLGALAEGKLGGF